jgi:3-mercaptopyruvate sulfurtransferase SseA
MKTTIILTIEHEKESSPIPGLVPRTYLAKVILEAGPMTTQKFVTASGWPYAVGVRVLQNLRATGVAKMVNLGGGRMKHILK